MMSWRNFHSIIHCVGEIFTKNLENFPLKTQTKEKLLTDDTSMTFSIHKVSAKFMEIKSINKKITKYKHCSRQP